MPKRSPLRPEKIMLSADQLRESAKALLRSIGPFVSTRYRGERVDMFPFELDPESIKQAEHHLFHLWEVFDKARMVPVDKLAVAAADIAFQRFLQYQCLKEGAA